MAKAKKDMIDAETFRMVKNMSMPELNTFLYSVYLAGYKDGRIDLGLESQHFIDSLAEQYGITPHNP